MALEHEAPVAVDERGPLATIIPELKAKYVQVEGYSTADMASACAGFYDKVADAQIKVLGPSELDDAVAAATKRTSGDIWFWGRKDARLDVSPLVALTLAVDLAAKRGMTIEPWAMWA